MTKYMFLMFIFMTSQNFSQNTLTGAITYSQIVNNANGSRFGSPYTLYFDLNRSFYERIGGAKRINNASDSENHNLGQQVSSKMMKNNLPQPYYYTNVRNQELIFREPIVDRLFVVRDTIVSIPWQMHEENKKIGKYNCQKAMAKYRGRQWTVWFTYEIPVSHGPWKLRGLPGLILEASEASGKFEFMANHIKLDVDDTDIEGKLETPDTSNVRNMKVYRKALKNKHAELSAKLKASLPRGAKLLKGCDFCPDPKNFNLEIYE